MRDTKAIISGVGVASIARNSVYLLGTRWFNLLIRFIYTIVLAYYLGPELYGLINYGISWYFAFLSFTGLGVAAILAREIGRDRASIAWTASLTFTLRASAALIAAVACGICGWFLETNSEARSILIIFSIALVGRSLALWAEAAFNAHEVNKFTFRIQTIFRTFEVVAGISLLLAGGGAMAVAIVHTISWLFQALSGLVLIQRRLVPIRFNFSSQGLKCVLYQGVPIGIGFVMVNWFLSGPLVLFRHLASSENSLGQLALAMQAFVILGSIWAAAGMASLPVLSRSVERKDGKDLLYADTMIRAGLIFGAFAGLAGLGAGPWLLNLVFGTRYMEAGYLLGLVLWLLIPFSCASTLRSVCLAKGKFILPTVCSGIGALVMTLIMPWSVAAMNTSGAVLAMATGMMINALTLIFLLARSDKIDIRQTIFRPLVVVVLALAVFLALKSVNEWLALMISWAVLLWGMLQFGGVTKDEKYLLKSIKRRWCLSGDADSRQPGS